MPGPPPPPPAAPPPPMPKFSAPSKGSGGGDPRDALLKSIHKGAKLRKVQTNDRSAPITNKTINNNNSSSDLKTSGVQNNSNSMSSPKPNGMMGLGGLFADGIPKLRPTGKLGYSATENSGTPKQQAPVQRQNSSPPPVQNKNVENIQNKIKKSLATHDNRNRGPPPPAPVRNFSDEGSARPNVLAKNGFNKPTNQMNFSGLTPNHSSLHQSKSNSNLNNTRDATDCPTPQRNGAVVSHHQPKPVINHGKPNLAPKPPASTGTLPNKPKKLSINGGKPVHRAQSMKSPRSPSPQSPEVANSFKALSVKDITHQIGSTLSLSGGGGGGGTGHSQKPRRPNAPPPSIPPMHQHSNSFGGGHSPGHLTGPGHLGGHGGGYPAPPKNTVKPPNHAPPPPPTQLPQVPNHAPPAPPPHRPQNRAPPAVPTHCAPPPPPRLSSMARAGLDVEDKFRYMFAAPDQFPRPPPFRNVLKVYSNKQESRC